MRAIAYAVLFSLCAISLSVNAMPRYINPPGEKVIIVDPNEHAWGAYAPNGTLVRQGVASTGADFCPDMGTECHTQVGSFRIRSLGSAGCTSPSFPMPNGGGPMPYCMYFNELQALHGYPHVSSTRNASHGCVRMKVADAAWVRYNFAQVGTLVVVKPYYN